MFSTYIPGFPLLYPWLGVAITIPLFILLKNMVYGYFGTRHKQMVKRYIYIYIIYIYIYGISLLISIDRVINYNSIISIINYPIGSMVLLYMVTWIPSIYPLYVSIYTSTMDPMGTISINFMGLKFKRQLLWRRGGSQHLRRPKFRPRTMPRNPGRRAPVDI